MTFHSNRRNSSKAQCISKRGWLYGMNTTLRLSTVLETPSEWLEDSAFPDLGEIDESMCRQAVRPAWADQYCSTSTTSSTVDQNQKSHRQASPPQQPRRLLSADKVEASFLPLLAPLELLEDKTDLQQYSNVRCKKLRNKREYLSKVRRGYAVPSFPH